MFIFARAKQHQITSSRDLRHVLVASQQWRTQSWNGVECGSCERPMLCLHALSPPLSIYLSIYLSVDLSIFLSVWLSALILSCPVLLHPMPFCFVQSCPVMSVPSLSLSLSLSLSFSVKPYMMIYLPVMHGMVVVRHGTCSFRQTTYVLAQTCLQRP